MRENSTVVPVVLFFNSIYHLVGVKFGDCYTTLDNLDTSQQGSVESWKNLAYRNINGIKFDHRLINGRPMPLLSSDVTCIPGSSSLSLHISNFQIRNSDQVDSASGASHYLFIEDTSIDLDNHQTEQYTSFAETNNLPLEMGNSSFDNISTLVPNSEFPNLLATHYASEACYESQPHALGIESLKHSQSIVKDAWLGRDNSLDFTIPMETAPIQPANCDEQATQAGFQNQAESPPFMDPLRVESTFSRLCSFDMSFFDGPISFSRMSSFGMNNFDGLIPASAGGETSRSIATPSPHPRWVKLLAPIKWVHFTKKRRARILIHQTLVAAV
ncbi:uncharacterized protein LOC109728056 isoform X1 [Ananas comosus]|uniref:Uncharacterized protein LOC109728056 isoform X1 n=1 Tax=Ananas comosus TaxID=4615 RepID=A0A6P5H1L1_ANACO|nr:uncharacterized protein LOC109728056 isoform X1 [Ananas comosus]